MEVDRFREGQDPPLRVLGGKSGERLKIIFIDFICILGYKYNVELIPFLYV